MQLQHSLHRPPSCIGGWLSSMCLLPGISPKPIAQFVTAFDACCPASCPCHLRRDIIRFSFSRELRNATATATDCSRLPDHALSIPSKPISTGLLLLLLRLWCVTFGNGGCCLGCFLWHVECGSGRVHTFFKKKPFGSDVLYNQL